MKYLWILLIIFSCLCLSSCAKKDVPTFEEYYNANTSADYTANLPPKIAADVEKRHRANLRHEYEWEYGDLMYHPDGSLRDQDLNDDVSAEGQYVILIALIWIVFFVWAGIGTKSPLGFIIVNAIGIVLGIITWLC